MYRIKAPSESYERKIGGIRFIKGVAETDDAWLASWFSGRPGLYGRTGTSRRSGRRHGGKTCRAGQEAGRKAREAG